MIADLGDDDPMILAIVGPKHTLLTIMDALASFSLEDEIEGLLS